MGKLTLILGGARSGKSTYAETLARQHGGIVAYIATAQALDSEMAERIRSHQATRPSSWLTLEIPLSIANTLKNSRPVANLYLLDCLTLLVNNLLMELDSPESEPDENTAAKVISEEILTLKEFILNDLSDWVVVSNEVGLGLVPPYPLGRIYRDWLGWANQQLAATADRVILMVAGLPWDLKKAV